MKTLYLILSVFLCVSLVTSQAKKEVKKVAPALAPVSKSHVGKIWGSTFADYSYIVQARDTTSEGKNAFEFRRIYFGYDQDISEQFSARVLLEANKSDTTSGSMKFFAKQAYVEWKNLVPMSSIYFGLSATPSIALAEKIWGYRSLEKVILDRKDFVSTTDMGIALKGKLVSDGSAGYVVMVGNGSGWKLENDKLKKFYATFNFEPMKGGVVELYADFENGSNGKSKLTGKGLVGYESPAATFGLEGFYRKVKNAALTTAGAPTDLNLIGASAYTSILFADGWRAVLRGDFYDPDFAVKNTGLREIFVIAGLDYTPAKDVHVIPNVLYTHYLYKKKLRADPTLKDDITVRLTFTYSFSTQL